MDNLSNQTQLIPSQRRRRKVVHLDYVEVKNYSHIVVKLDPYPFPCCVNIDVYNKRERTRLIGDKFSSDNKIFFRLHFPILYNTSRLFAWRVHGKMVGEKCDGHANSVGIFRQDNQQTHNFLKNESVLVRFNNWKSAGGDIDLYLDKNCNYTISTKLAWMETAGQIFRTYWRLLPSYVSSIILMSIGFQPPSGWRNFPRVLLGNAYYLTIVPAFIISFALITIPNDYALMIDQEEYMVLLPFGLYLVAFTIVFSVGVLLYVLLLTVGNSYHAFVVRFFTKRLGSVPEKVTEFAISLAFDKLPVSIAVLILAVAISTCGSMGFGVGLFFFLVKVFKCYEDVLEGLLRKTTLELGEAFSASNFHLHFAVVWLLLTALNIPALFYWINNFRYFEPPQWDLSLYLCLMVAPALAILWQGFVPDFNKRLWRLQKCMCYITGMVAVIWGTFRIYFISFLIVIVILTIAGCQLISLMAPRDDSGNSGTSAAGDDMDIKPDDAPVDDVSNSSEEDFPMEETVSESENDKDTK